MSVKSGKLATMDDLAKSAGVSKIHARRMLRCAALSPALTAQILEGRQPGTFHYLGKNKVYPSSLLDRHCIYQYMDQDVYKHPEPSVNPEPRYCGRPFAEINAINQEFWRKRAENRERQLRDEHLAKEAFNDLQEQMQLQGPIGRQKPYEVLLDRAEERRERVLLWVRQENGRQGGKARKPDTLQAVIQKIVERNPTIDCPTLLQSLQNKRGIGVIQDVDDEDICFTDANGRSKSAKVTGLKDRLARARKKFKSQKAVSASQA